MVCKFKMNISKTTVAIAQDSSSPLHQNLSLESLRLFSSVNMSKTKLTFLHPHCLHFTHYFIYVMYFLGRYI